MSGNLLTAEKSPYLLQHAGNPVHWRPWSTASFEEARARDCPLLVSVGYAACHWCHVMAHESFEDAEVAALMNRLFVNVKVDREERPDVDHVLMSALQALGEQGGWPLTMFLMPDGRPFWGGTYFPPSPRWGRPSFRQVLTAVSAAYRAGDPALRTNAEGITDHLVRASSVAAGDWSDKVPDAVAERLLALVDHEGGGLRGAPKFPNAPIFRFLWQHAMGRDDERGRSAVTTTLRRMSCGGIFDHLGGGFARYATDAIWLVPHFEKMLYDNALILELLAFAHAAAPDPLWRARAEGVVAWLVRDMTSDGAFAASEDADSEGEEGRFYVWTAAEIQQVLGAAGRS